MTDKQNILEIDNIEYHFTDGDFFETEKQARKLLNFADGLIEVKMIETDEGKQPGFEFNLGAVLGNLSGANFDSIRDFIFKTIKVVNRDENKGVLFASKADQSAHFNAHRSHYTQVLVTGLKYHFLEFVPSGEAFAKTIFGQAMNRAIAKAV